MNAAREHCACAAGGGRTARSSSAVANATEACGSRPVVSTALLVGPRGGFPHRSEAKTTERQPTQNKIFEGHITGIVKYDVQRGLATKHTTGPGLHLDEAMFVPAGEAEDDGYLLAFVYERQRNKSSLLILDASDMSQPPIAQVKLPVRVPIGLHGYWLPQSAIGG